MSKEAAELAKTINTDDLDDLSPREFGHPKKELEAAYKLLEALPGYIEAGDHDNAHSMMLGALEIQATLEDRSYKPAKLDALKRAIVRSYHDFNRKWPKDPNA